MTRRPLVLVMAIVIGAGALSACRRKAEPAPVPATPTVGASARGRADSLTAAELAQRRADSVAAAQRAAAATAADAQRAQVELSAALQQRVYFEYDRDALRDDAVASLDIKAAILLANPGVTLAITGHTDERGTAEYNLALGQRRAAQVKRYLVSRGIADARLSTQSLGDSQPAVQGTDEAAYQQNRRAEFAVGNEGGALVRPRT